MKIKIALAFVVVVLAVATSGCATNAPTALAPTLAEKVAKMEKGKTTFSEAVSALGEPAGIMVVNDGKSATFGKTSVSSPTYIPVVGAFMARSATMTGSTATLIFDKNDVLVSKIVHQY